jgi:hypothetical protein
MTYGRGQKVLTARPERAAPGSPALREGSAGRLSRTMVIMRVPRHAVLLSREHAGGYLVRARWLIAGNAFGARTRPGAGGGCGRSGNARSVGIRARRGVLRHVEAAAVDLDAADWSGSWGTGPATVSLPAFPAIRHRALVGACRKPLDQLHEMERASPGRRPGIKTSLQSSLRHGNPQPGIASHASVSHATKYEPEPGSNCCSPRLRPPRASRPCRRGLPSPAAGRGSSCRGGWS